MSDEVKEDALRPIPASASPRPARKAKIHDNKRHFID